MTRQVLFNGAVLVRAGGATKVDLSAFQSIGIAGVGVVALVGEADEGEPNVVKLFRDARAMVDEYGSGALADAADLAFSPMNDVRVPGGASSVLAVKTNAGTRATKTLVDGSSNDVLVLTARKWGVDTNKISAQVATSGTGKTIEFIFKKGVQDPVTETSPALGSDAEFTIQYTGDATTGTITTTATSITTTLAGDQTDGSQNLTINFSDYPTLADIIDFINGQTGYTAVAVTNNPFAFLGANLDFVSAVDIKTAVTDIKAQLWRMIEWVNNNSELVSGARATGAGNGEVAPADVGPELFTGGTRGTSDDTAWTNAFNLLKAVRANQVVPLASEDLTNEGNGSTATIASIVSTADSHAALMSSTSGRSERQAFIGYKGNLTAVLAQAGALQSPHTVLTAQRISRPNAAGSVVEFPEWGLAVMAAGGRAGSVLGEPLTWKGIRCSAITQDSSWSPSNNGADLILGGVTFAFQDNGFKFDRVVTTYTKTDNDALVEESIVQGWKVVSYDLRTGVEAIFTGTKARQATREDILSVVQELLEGFRQEEQIVDSVLADGSTLKAYRELAVTLTKDQARLSAIISPVAGINFTLNTLFVVPAVISG